MVYLLDELISKVRKGVCGPRLGSETGGVRTRGIKKNGNRFEGQVVTEKKPGRPFPRSLGKRKEE